MSPYNNEPQGGNNKLLYVALMLILTLVVFFIGVFISLLTLGERIGGEMIPVYSNSVIALVLGHLTYILLYYVASRFISRKLNGNEVGLYASLPLFSIGLLSFAFAVLIFS